MMDQDLRSSGAKISLLVPYPNLDGSFNRVCQKVSNYHQALSNLTFNLPILIPFVPLTFSE